MEFADFLVLEDSSLLGDEFYHRFGPHFVWHDDRAHPIERRLRVARRSQTDMGTIAVWAFFILWGIGLIQSLVHRNLSLAFNFAFQMYVAREFVVGDVGSNWTTIIVAIFVCWGVFVLSCIPSAIMRARQRARWEREGKGKLA
jgi:hypothetical protein